MAGGMQHTGAGIGHMGDNADEIEVVHETNGILARSLQAERDDAARTVGEVFLAKGIILVGGQAAIAHPRHALVLFEPLCHLLRITAMLLHAEMEGLKTEVEEEGVLGSRNASEVTHQLGYELRAICRASESLGIDQAVVRLVGSGKTGEMVGMGLPVEVAGIHHTSSHLSGMAIHVLRSGMGDDVASPLKRTAVDGRGKGVVYD